MLEMIKTIVLFAGVASVFLFLYNLYPFLMAVFSGKKTTKYTRKENKNKLIVSIISWAIFSGCFGIALYLAGSSVGESAKIGLELALMCFAPLIFGYLAGKLQK